MEAVPRAERGAELGAELDQVSRRSQHPLNGDAYKIGHRAEGTPMNLEQMFYPDGRVARPEETSPTLLIVGREMLVPTVQ